MSMFEIIINVPKRYFLTIKKHVSWEGEKMETSDTLISLVGIFETKVKHCRKKNGLSINYSWHKYRELKGTLLWRYKYII